MPKKNGNGGIREVSPGKYIATMYEPRAKGGTKHIGTFTAEFYGSRAEARAAAERAKRAAEHERDEQLTAEKSGGLQETVGSFARRWPTDYPEKKSEQTLHWYTDRLKAFIRDFGDRPLAGDGAISVSEARAWVQGGIVPDDVADRAKHWKDAEELASGQIEVPHHKGNYVAVRKVMNDAASTWRGEVFNPFNGLGITRSPGREHISVLTEGELALLVQSAHDVLGADEITGRTYGIHFGALIEAAAWTGVRVGEIRAFNLDDSDGNYVDFKNGEIQIRGQWDVRANKFRKRPKTDAGYRTVFMLPPAETALRVAAAGREEGPLFLQKREPRRISVRTLNDDWGKVRAGFWAKLSASRQKEIPPGFDFYELRHFFGTQLAEIHVSAEEIANQMGHNDGGRLAQKLYIHPRSEAVRNSVLQRFSEHQRRKAIGE